jgi:hypothetical protein
MKIALSVTLLLVISSPTISQTVIYTRQFTKPEATNFLKVSTKHVHLINIFPPNDTVSINYQIGVPLLSDKKTNDFISVGVGVEGEDGFDRMTFGFWGKKQLWKSNERWKLGALIKRSTFNLSGYYTIRWVFPLIYKETLTIAPELFSLRKPEKIIYDFGITADLGSKIYGFKFSLGLTYWLDREILFLSTKIILPKTPP